MGIDPFITASAHIQAKLVRERIEELRKTLSPYNHRQEAALKMIKLLQEYAEVLSGGPVAEDATDPRPGSYYIATDTVPVSEWLGFEHVYQVHCPRLFLNESVRDVGLLAPNLGFFKSEFTVPSRSLWSITTVRVHVEDSNTSLRHGKSYGATHFHAIHFQFRAVKFIRDQEVTKQHKPAPRRSVEVQIPQSKGIAQAMQMLRQSFSTRDTAGGLENILADAYADAPRPGLNPLEGWKEGVSLKQSHFCVLLKPQIVLHSESGEDSTCVVAAGVAKLKINDILDNENADDPINGIIMSR